MYIIFQDEGGEPKGKPCLKDCGTGFTKMFEVNQNWIELKLTRIELKLTRIELKLTRIELNWS